MTALGGAMFDRIFCTDERRWYAVPLRAALGIIFGLHGIRTFLVGGEYHALSLAVLGAAVSVGLLTRPVAALMAVFGAIGLMRLPVAHVASWSDFDGTLMIMGAAGALIIIGGGRLSVDSLIQERLIYCHLSAESAEDEGH